MGVDDAMGWRSERHSLAIGLLAGVVVSLVILGLVLRDELHRAQAGQAAVVEAVNRMREAPPVGRYQFVSYGAAALQVFDTQTGEFWVMGSDKKTWASVRVGVDMEKSKKSQNRTQRNDD